MAKREIVHELSWSPSRAASFEECRRRYYYDYYLSWKGWEATAPKPRRDAWLLKKMTRMPMLAGDLLHQAIARFFDGKQQGHVATERELLEWAVGELRSRYKESRDGKWKMRPAKLTHLAEHHYEEACIDEGTGAAGTYGKRFVQRLRDGLGAFFALPELEPARGAEPKDFVATEELGTFDFDGTKVFAVPDFAFRDAEGRLRLFDWKTGAPRDEDRFQLAVYALYAEAEWGATPTEVRCADVYLTEPRVVEVAFDAAELDATRERIADSLGAMRRVHFDAGAEEGDPDGYPMAEPSPPGSVGPCTFCHYRAPCDRVG